MQDQVQLRLYLLETDKFEGAPAYQAIARYLLKHDFAGATVYRGLEGYGTTHKLHSADVLDLSANLPVIIEVIDTPDHISAFERHLKDSGLARGRLITEQPVRATRLQ